VPDRGLLEPATLSVPALGAAHSPPWAIARARIAQITCEVDQAAVLESIPCDVSRPVPCYARLFLLDAEDSPIGPFRLAALLAGGRFRMFPRNVLVAGVFDGPVDEVARAFGGPFSAGTVTLERAGLEVSATVAAEGAELARIRWPSLHAIEPTMLRWDAWLGYAGDGKRTQIVEYGPRPDPEAAFLTKAATLDMGAGLARGHTWRRFRNLNMVSGCYVEGPLELTAPVVQQVLQ
jgi:hypothetical protein